MTDNRQDGQRQLPPLPLDADGKPAALIELDSPLTDDYAAWLEKVTDNAEKARKLHEHDEGKAE